MNWENMIKDMKSEMDTVLAEQRSQLANPEKTGLAKKLGVSSKLSVIATPLLENVRDIYGDGTRILSNPPQYDLCLCMKGDVELFLKCIPNREKFVAEYKYSLDDSYYVKGALSVDERLEIPINEEGIKEVIKSFLEEYTRISAQLERNLLRRNQQPSVAVRSE